MTHMWLSKNMITMPVQVITCRATAIQRNIWLTQKSIHRLLSITNRARRPSLWQSYVAVTMNNRLRNNWKLVRSRLLWNRGKAVRCTWRSFRIVTRTRLQSQSLKTKPWILNLWIIDQEENWCWMRIRSQIWTPTQVDPSTWISSHRCQLMTLDSNRFKSMINPFSLWNHHPRSLCLKHSKKCGNRKKSPNSRMKNLRREQRSRLWGLRKQCQTSKVESQRFSKRSARLILMRMLTSQRPSAVSMKRCSKRACKQQPLITIRSSVGWPLSMNNLTHL